MARWRRWRQFSILTIFSDFLVMNGSKNTISLSKHIGKKYETFTSHFRTLWFCVFFWKLPSKEQFLCVKKEIAYHYSRMKSGKNINSSLWKRLSSFYFQSDQESVQFKSILQSIEKMRSSSSLFNVERSLSRHFWQSHWSAWP